MDPAEKAAEYLVFWSQLILKKMFGDLENDRETHPAIIFSYDFSVDDTSGGVHKPT
jgi:hypothetical protein